MVYICPITHYDKSNETKYQNFFEKYPYELHIFQKYALEAIIEGNHVLVCAPTGSGKTLPGEFSIDYFVSKGKKVIYTTPIKALSNQKFYDFTQKYPHISVGLITGDIKTNPDADCLIMTTEILLNKLYQIYSNSKQVNSSVSFDMDIENELGCVVFDEVHMINDESRGHVWEQSIMMLPENIQMVMLSATIDAPEKFANWCEERYTELGKRVYLTRRMDRAVPLTHYSFITTNNGIFKAIKDKQVHQEIKNIIDKPFVIQDSTGKFDETHYFKMNKMLKLFENNQVYVKRQHVLNQVSKYLVENEMLPALCFVFSRKQLEKCAREVTTNLLEFDSKVPYTIRYECESIMRKFPNYQEYLELPEYLSLVSLLEKGIGIHHSGVMPPLREMVELLYSKGYIKLLFCTETLSVGINMPVKTAIFTDVNKFDGNINRVLYSHEYTQAAGRAGRLGLDKVGHVIHLNNLFRNVDSVSYKNMMNNKPPILKSKFKISYNLLLSLIDIGKSEFTKFAERSMIKDVLDNEAGKVYSEISKITLEIENSKHYMSNYLNTPFEKGVEYIELNEQLKTSVNKKKREIEKRIQELKDECKHIISDVKMISIQDSMKKKLSDKEKEYEHLQSYLKENTDKVVSFLMKNDCVEKDTNSSKYSLTTKGCIANLIKEVHCLAFSEIMSHKLWSELTSVELIQIFSCFTNIVVDDEKKSFKLDTEDKKLEEIMDTLDKMYNCFKEYEMRNEIDTGIDYSIHYDLIDYVEEWCKCEDIGQCKNVLERAEKEKNIFLGEFVKAILKINNISSEMEKIAEYIGDMGFLSKLREIPNMTLKYVVTNQSLYV